MHSVINTRPSDSRPDRIRTLEVSIPEAIIDFNYRCPVCGEMVDASSAEQILLHHEHATHPRDFLCAKAAVA